MREADKLEEAEYFLKQMVAVAGDRKAHKFNLSAFLSAARSVLQFGLEEVESKPGGKAWYDTQVTGKPVVKFFKDRRDVNIHIEPVSPVKQIQVNIEETLHFSDKAEAVIIRDGKPVLSEPPQRHSFRLPEGTNWPYPSKVTMSETYRFNEWKGSEDVPTLCGIYLLELRKIVADGQSKGYLTP